jgi:hypothetical protein
MPRADPKVDAMESSVVGEKGMIMQKTIVKMKTKGR